MATHPVLLPGKSHGWRSLVGCSPWGHWGSDMTDRLPFHFSLSCIGEGNGNPLQCSCLEDPRDRGSWGAALYGVAQSRTQLKRLSSSSSRVTSADSKVLPVAGSRDSCGSLPVQTICGHPENTTHSLCWKTVGLFPHYGSGESLSWKAACTWHIDCSAVVTSFCCNMLFFSSLVLLPHVVSSFLEM